MIDLTGEQIMRPPASLNRSSFHSRIEGLRFDGSFYTGSTTFGAGAVLQEAVFFHTKRCYAGGAEYGFVRDVLSGTFFFYWTTNGNCGISPSFCRKFQGGQPNTPNPNPPVLENDGNFDHGLVLLDPGPTVRRFEAIAFRDPADSRYKFKISISHPDTLELIFETIVTPGEWFPLQEIIQSGGYVTVTMNKIDPADTIRYLDVPYLDAQSMSIASSEILGITNSASSVTGPIAPGELLTLYGPNIGPAELILGSFDQSGKLPTTLGGTRVLFDNTPAPMIYSSANQAAVIAPFQLAGATSSKIQVEYQGSPVVSATATVIPAAPGIFTLNATGRGAAVVVNEDNTLNSPAKPAAKGSNVYFYATGGGIMTPSVQIGTRAPITPPFPTVQLPVEVTVGGVPAAVSYAGAAPGFVYGVLQINIRIPEDSPTGSAVPLVLSVGGKSSTQIVTLAIE